MALDPVPWFIGGGASHSADVARLLVHVATNGAAGVVAPTDMKVTQLPAATGTVRVGAGACIVPNTNAFQQSYALRAPSVTDLAVTATGSTGGRSDMVVALVDDPQFTGQPAGDPTNGPYVRFHIITGVSSTAKKVPASFGFPAIPLARIDLPANTAAVTDAMIVDLRKLPAPRSERKQSVHYPPSDLNMSTTAYTNWPLATPITVDVPTWATNVKIVCHISGAEILNADASGGLRTTFAGVPEGQNGLFVGSVGRQHLVVIGDHTVTSSQRGASVTLGIEGWRTGGTGTAQADYQTSVVIDYEFEERPE